MLYPGFVASLRRSCNTPHSSVFLPSHRLTSIPGIQSYPMSLIHHVLSPWGLLCTPFPLPRTECTPSSSSSLWPFKIKLRGACAVHVLCHVTSSCSFTVVGMLCPSPWLWTQSKPCNLLWPTEWSGNDGGPVWSLAQETYSKLSSSITVRASSAWLAGAWEVHKAEPSHHSDPRQA